MSSGLEEIIRDLIQVKETELLGDGFDIVDIFFLKISRDRIDRLVEKLERGEC